MELGEAVELCANLLGFFEGRGVRVIRLGLHSSPELERSRIAGPYHPAFRELCQSRLFLRRIESALGGREGEYRLLVSPRDLSAVLGQKRANVEALRERGFRLAVVPRGEIPRGCFAVCLPGEETGRLFSPQEAPAL